ncbi:MAG: MFS transporter [Planctomycetes bacterium]|nr:MFS transporter [Planctomycetota bacterium]
MAQAETSAGTPKAATGSWLSRNVLMLGLISLLTDTASEAAIPLLPVFIVSLGAGAMALGWIEGIAEATSSILKLVTGKVADRVGKNRPFVVGGYSLSSAAKPLIALATAPWHVLVVRIVDRVGKGFRSSPRDALIAASVPPAQRAAAFSLHRSMDHAGAVIGPLLAAAYLYWVGSQTQDLRLLFWLTAVPGVLVILAAVFGVQELPKPAPSPKAQAAQAGQSLVRFLVPLGLFTLGNASDVFLLLKVAQGHVDLVTFPLLWVGLHIVKVASSIPGGKLADRIGRRRVICMGWVLYAAIYAGFAFVEDQHTTWALLAVYGLYYGLTEGPEKALIAEIAPRDKRGAAYGWYYLTLGMLALAASVMFGALWEYASPMAAFLTSAALALAAVVAFAALGPPRATTQAAASA